MLTDAASQAPAAVMRAELGSPASRLPLRALAVQAALWPLWGYLLRAYTAPGSDPAPGILLLAVLIWAVWRAAQTPLGAARPSWTPGLLAIYAAAYMVLPPLGRAMLGLLVLGAALAEEASMTAAETAGVLALLALSAPAIDTLSFVLGGPLRGASTGLAALWLAGTGAPAHADGAVLRIGDLLYSVDAPCSGVNGFWTSLVAAGVLGLRNRLSPGRLGILLILAAGSCVPANAWRAVALVSAGRIHPEILTGGNPTVHAGVGIVVFASVMALLIAAATWLSRVRLPALRITRPRRPRLPNRRALSLAAMAAALVPLLPAGAKERGLSGRFPGWPATWAGEPIVRIPDTELDRRWGSSGEHAHFLLPNGDELLLRWVERPGREVHPSEDCYRGQGWMVLPLEPARAPASLGTHAKPVIWRRFAAQRAGEKLRVREAIVSENGRTYSDPSWWWWQVAGPGASDRGPWWFVVIQSHR